MRLPPPRGTLSPGIKQALPPAHTHTRTHTFLSSQTEPAACPATRDLDASSSRPFCGWCITWDTLTWRPLSR